MFLFAKYSKLCKKVQGDKIRHILTKTYKEDSISVQNKNTGFPPKERIISYGYQNCFIGAVFYRDDNCRLLFQKKNRKRQ